MSTIYWRNLNIIAEERFDVITVNDCWIGFDKNVYEVIYNATHWAI